MAQHSNATSIRSDRTNEHVHMDFTDSFLSLPCDTCVCVFEVSGSRLNKLDSTLNFLPTRGMGWYLKTCISKPYLFESDLSSDTNNRCIAYTRFAQVWFSITNEPVGKAIKYFMRFVTTSHMGSVNYSETFHIVSCEPQVCFVTEWQASIQSC